MLRTLPTTVVAIDDLPGSDRHRLGRSVHVTLCR
jgi:hypothetical protein